MAERRRRRSVDVCRSAQVAFATPFYEPNWSFGGVLRASADRARALAAAGAEVTVLTTNAGAAEETASQRGASERRDGIGVH